jgi:hypothetical protein
MAAHRRRVAVVGSLAFLSLLLGVTALRALAQAPDREDYLLPADTQIACDDFLIGSTWDDGEVYAGGPIEQQGIQNADTSHDWANPGTNAGP